MSVCVCVCVHLSPASTSAVAAETPPTIAVVLGMQLVAVAMTIF